MKNSNLWMLLFPILFSCSMEDNFPASDVPGFGTAPLQKNNTAFGNAQQGFAAGAVQNELLDALITRGDTASTLIVTLKEAAVLAVGLPAFKALSDEGFSMPSETRLAYLTDGVSGRLDDVITHASLSERAKLSLTNFANSLAYYSGQQPDYEGIDQFILSFEASVIADSTFDSKDLKVLLTTASLSQHAFKFASTHKKRKPRDRDWDISVGHIAIAIELSEGPPAIAALACAAVLFQENY